MSLMDAIFAQAMGGGSSGGGLPVVELTISITTDDPHVLTESESAALIAAVEQSDGAVLIKARITDHHADVDGNEALLLNFVPSYMSAEGFEGFFALDYHANLMVISAQYDISLIKEEGAVVSYCTETIIG